MKKRVLYVEDEEASFKAVRRYLVDGNVDVEIKRAGGVQEFWDAYGKGGWDLILLDVMLPAAETEVRIDPDAGIKIVETLKERSNGIPVVFITGRWRLDVAIRALEGVAFVRQVMSKPLGVAALCKAVRKALRASGSKTRTRRE